MTRPTLSKRIMHGTCIALALAAIAMAGGCDTAEGNAFLGALFGVGALNETNPRTANAYAGLSQFLTKTADYQAAQEAQATPQTVIVKQQ